MSSEAPWDVDEQGRPVKARLSTLTPAPRPTCPGGFQSRGKACRTERTKKLPPERKAAGKYVLRFGQHKGQTLSQVQVENPGYIDWILAYDGFDNVEARRQCYLFRGVTLPKELSTLTPPAAVNVDTKGSSKPKKKRWRPPYVPREPRPDLAGAWGRVKQACADDD